MDQLISARDQLTIACDIDGPLFWDEGRMADFFTFAERQGHNCSFDKFIRTGSIAQAFEHYCRPTCSQLWNDFLTTTKLFQHPTPGMRQAIKQLRRHQLVITTARDMCAAPATKHQLHRQCHHRFSQYFFSLDRKTLAVEQSGAHYMIEDSLSVAEEVAQMVPQCQVILFPTPHVPRQSSYPNLIRLPCEDNVKQTLALPQWRAVCEQAWHEIVSIISP